VTTRRSGGRQPWRRVLFALVLVAATIGLARTSPPAVGHPLRVESVRDIGPLVGPPGWLRDGAQSIQLGSRILWTFGDTLFPVLAVDGSLLRTNTAAWSDRSHPRVLHGPVDANGAPVQFIPFTESEEVFNQPGSGDRIAVWPTSIIRRGPDSAAVLFATVKVGPGTLNYTFLGTGVATVSAGSSAAARRPEPVFRPPDPSFANGAVMVGALVYVYGCARIEGLQLGCRVARTTVTDIGERSAYRFWDGSGWSSKVGSAVVTLPGPSGGLSVSWNPWLGRYLSVYNLALTNRVEMRTALSPEGPWSRPVTAFTGRSTDPGRLNNLAFEHPELASDGGRTVTISYTHPVGARGGEIRLVEVTFARPGDVR